MAQNQRGSGQSFSWMALAQPDNQGNSGFCSRFALANAVANGFMERKFWPEKQLDFVQREIIMALVNEHPVSNLFPDLILSYLYTILI